MSRLPAAVRVLQQRRVPHGVHRFDQSIRSADEVATALGLPLDAVYKTLVLEGDSANEPIILMAPAGLEVDLKRLAASLELKRVRMLPQRDAERVTGMQAGAISAIPLANRRFRVLIAKAALERDTVLVSAGEHGADIELSVQDLMAVTNAETVSL